MPDHTCAADDSDRQEAADGGYFAPLVLARYMRLTTFTRDGVPVSASVRGVVDGDRAYVCARNRSGTAKRLRHAGVVQVTPSGGLGFTTYGPPLNTIARPLSGVEASLVAAKLDRRYPVWRRFLIGLPRRQAVYYELLEDEGGGRQDGQAEEPASSLVVRVHTSHRLMHADAATAASLSTVCAPSSTASSRPSGYARVTTVSMSLSAARPADT